MKDLINQHGLMAFVMLVAVLLNVILTAIKTGIEKIEDFLTGGDATKIDPNSALEKFKAVIVKILGFLSGVIDWLTGNKAH